MSLATMGSIVRAELKKVAMKSSSMVLLMIGVRKTKRSPSNSAFSPSPVEAAATCPR